MSEAIDGFVTGRLGDLISSPPQGMPRGWDPAVNDELLVLLDAQLAARHVDLCARELQARGEGFHTIGSLGHESNAAIALALRPTDPALLHYRSAGFYCARAAQTAGHDPVRDILLSLMASVMDPISGGRHKVFGNKALAIIPQTSTVASHLPRALGLAYAHERAHSRGVGDEWPPDAVVVTTLGDASLNHSTATGALNSAQYLAYGGEPLPLLIVVEDNGLGISVPSPEGWVKTAIARLDGIAAFAGDGSDPVELLRVAREAVDHVRRKRLPVVLHLKTVRLGGHAGSDVETAYRSQRHIRADYDRDPLLATFRVLIERDVLTPQEALKLYEDVRARVALTTESLLPPTRLNSAAAIGDPIHARADKGVAEFANRSGPDRTRVFRGKLPENAGPLTLAQTINATLADLLHAHDQAIVFGEDVGVKGGVYGVTRGLRAGFGVHRVFDTLLDEQTILGMALGSALAGFLPIPEIQYLAYVHNALDQLRGEAATLSFFSNGQYRNGMIVRIAGLAYQKGFGGHFHNDNSVAALLDIPGLVVAVPSSADEAPGLLRLLAGMALAEGRPTVFLEPIALYHSRDLVGVDGLALAPYRPPTDWESALPSRDEGRLLRHGLGSASVLVVTFGNGVGLTLRALRSIGGAVDIYDLRFLSPLPAKHLSRIAGNYAAVLVVDETRRSGGVSERVFTSLVEAGYPGLLRRVASEDSFIPLGPAAGRVLLDEARVTEALSALSPVSEHPLHES